MINQPGILLKSVFLHKPVGGRHCTYRGHAALHFLVIRHFEPLLRHILQSFSLRLQLGDLHLQPEGVHLPAALPYINDVLSVVVYHGQLQGDAVHQCQKQSHRCSRCKENKHSKIFSEQQGNAEEYGRRDQIHQHSAQIIKDIRNLSVCQIRRPHQALSACSGQGKSPEDNFSSLLDPHETSDSERAEPVTAQQSEYQMTAFMDHGLQKGPDINRNNQSRHHKKEFSRLCTRQIRKCRQSITRRTSCRNRQYHKQDSCRFPAFL